MPEKVNDTGESKSYSTFNMPFQNSFDKRNVPFIVYLKSHEYTGQSSHEKCHSEDQIPEFSVKLKGIIPDSIEKVTD